MKVFIAEAHPGIPEIGIVSGVSTRFQQPIKDNLLSLAKNVFTADIILVPHDSFDFVRVVDYVKYVREISRLKPLIIFDTGDFPKNIKIKNSIAIRSAINPGESHNNKIISPYNVLSLAHLPYRDFRKLPTIGFMGHVPRIIAPRRLVKSMIQSPHHPVSGNGSIVRRIALRQVEKQIENFKFTVRDHPNTSPDSEILRKIERIEYVDAIKNLDIGLAPRGDANQSLRLYELLSAGRIPLVPNTQIKFPKISEDQLWQRKIISFNLFTNKLNEIISYYWSEVGSKSSYHKLQLSLRNLFLNHLEYNIFMTKLFDLQVDNFLKLANFNSNE